MNKKLLREYIGTILSENRSGSEIAASGADYEKKLVDNLESVGIRTAGVAGFTSAADVTLIRADGTSFGIEAKTSAQANMGSAGMRYDPQTETLSVSNPNSPIGSEVLKILDTIHSDLSFMSAIKSVYDAGFLQRSAPSIELVKWRTSTGLPSQPGRSYRLDNSDLIARHYQAKKSTAEYIQIMGRGLYIMNAEVDPLGLSALGAAVLTAPVSISVKIAQKGSSTPEPGKISKLSMSAKANILSGGLQRSGLDLDNPDDLERLKIVLGY